MQLTQNEGTGSGIWFLFDRAGKTSNSLTKRVKVLGFNINKGLSSLLHWRDYFCIKMFLHPFQKAKEVDSAIV